VVGGGGGGVGWEGMEGVFSLFGMSAKGNKLKGGGTVSYILPKWEGQGVENGGKGMANDFTYLLFWSLQ
jgi:hypothetical protein